MTYDPNLGRWLEEDPIGLDAGDMNLYRMEGNNPVDAVDPSGLKLVVGGQEVTGGADQTYKDIIQQFFKDPYKRELDAVIEMLDTMIKSPVEKKTYTFKSADDLVKQLKLRLFVIIGAREAARGGSSGRLQFPGDNTVAKFPNSEYWEAVKVKHGNRELTGIRLKRGKSAFKAIDEIATAKPGNPVSVDCASSVALSILTGLGYYLTLPSEFDKRFKDTPLVIAGPCGLGRFITLPKDGERQDLLPGDTRTFDSRGARKPAYQNENTIYLGEDKYYAPGIGIMSFNDLKNWLGDKKRSFNGIVIPGTSFGKPIVPE